MLNTKNSTMSFVNQIPQETSNFSFLVDKDCEDDEQKLKINIFHKQLGDPTEEKHVAQNQELVCAKTGFPVYILLAAVGRILIQTNQGLRPNYPLRQTLLKETRRNQRRTSTSSSQEAEMIKIFLRQKQN